MTTAAAAKNFRQQRIEAQKEAASAQNNENVLIDVFVAMGGNPDKSGHVEATTIN